MGQIKEYGNFEVVAGCDLLEERVAEFCRKWEIPRNYTDFGEMLENENLDAILIATPNYAHMEPAVKALEGGINVYCENRLSFRLSLVTQPGLHNLPGV